MKKTIGREFFNLTNDISNLMFNAELVKKSSLKLSRVESNFLHFLMEEDKPVNMKDIARYLNVSPSRITHIMNSLIKKGYIDRYASTEDRRVAFGCISDYGKEVLTDYINEVVKTYNKILGNISEEKIEHIVEALTIWKELLDKLPKSSGYNED